VQTTPDAIPTAAPAAGSDQVRPTHPADGADEVDTDTIQRTILRALAHGSASPCREELVELEALLRGHIHLLLPYARARANSLPPAGARWLRHQARLAWIGNQVRRGLGDGMQSARQQVRSLALDCRWLLRQLPGRDRKTTP